VQSPPGALLFWVSHCAYRPDRPRGAPPPRAGTLRAFAQLDAHGVTYSNLPWLESFFTSRWHPSPSAPATLLAPLSVRASLDLLVRPAVSPARSHGRPRWPSWCVCFGFRSYLLGPVVHRSQLFFRVFAGFLTR